jgi:FkbM family methyltransferase
MAPATAGGVRVTAYRGTHGHRPYAGAGWYYAEYRDRVSAEFMARLARHLGWSPAERVLDLGAGPGQLSILAAPLVAEVVAIEPEPDMLAEGERRARAAGAGNVRFAAASAEDLPRLRAWLGVFRTALMGQSFHWMADKDGVLRDLGDCLADPGGSVAIVTPRRLAVPDALAEAHKIVLDILETYIAGVPSGPHPQGRHDAFETILARSPFARVESISHEYQVRVRPTLESLVGPAYATSYVLARLGDRRPRFEQEVRAALGDLQALTRRDEALIGRRQSPSVK